MSNLEDKLAQINDRPTPSPALSNEQKTNKARASLYGAALFGDNSFSGYLFEQQTLGNITSEEAEDLSNAMEGVTRNIGKGVAVGPFTAAPDLVGMATEFLNWSTQLASERVYGDQRGAVNIPVISGDPIRETVGLDPDDISGMVGEVFGGWESMVAKGGTIAAKAFSASMSEFPGAVMAGIWGTRAAKNLGDPHLVARLHAAESRLSKGDNPASVLADTGWYRDEFDSKMKLFRSDADMKINANLIKKELKHRQKIMNLKEGDGTIVSFKAKDIINDPELFKAYPALAEANISFHLKHLGDHPSGKGASWAIFNKAKADDGIKAEFIESDALGETSFQIYNVQDEADFGRSSILHEVQHWIQNYEGFSRGNSTLWLESKADDYFDAVLFDNMLEHRRAGRLKELDTLVKEEQFAMEYAMSHGLDPDDANLIDDISRAVSDAKAVTDGSLDNISEVSQQVLNRTKTDAVQYLSLGETDDLLKHLDKHPELRELYSRAADAYRRTGGEVEARVVEYLRDKRTASIAELQGRVGIEHPLKEGQSKLPAPDENL